MRLATRRAWGLGALLLCLGAGAAAGDAGTPSPWTPEQAKRLVERVSKREPFLGSPDARTDPRSMDRFFRAGDYARLHGNPVIGYWDARGFEWTGTRVAWDGVVSVAPSARRITKRAWDAAFAHVARQQGLTVDPKAPIRIRGACVAAVVRPSVTEPNRGVLIEMRIDGPKGAFLYRLGVGKPTLEDAVGASLDWAIAFARAQGEPGAP